MGQAAGVDESCVTRVPGQRLSNLERQHRHAIRQFPVTPDEPSRHKNPRAARFCECFPNQKVDNLVLVPAQSRDDARAAKRIWSPMQSSCRESQPAGPVGVLLPATQLHHRAECQR